MKTILATTNQVEIINLEDFLQQVLYKLALAFICHVVMIEVCSPEIHPSQSAQISAATTKPVILLKNYKNFEDVFLTKNARHLSLYKHYDHAINLVDGK